MLKIIPTPTEYKFLYTLPDDRFREFIKFVNGIFFEYIDEDGVTDVKFFYAMNKILILDGPFSSNFSLQEMLAFFECYIHPDDLWTWLDNNVTLRIIKKLPPTDKNISGIWKMDTFLSVPSKYTELISSYIEYEVSETCGESPVSTSIVRSLPYYCGSGQIKLSSSDEKNKTYWITLCLLKYQRQLKQQSKE